MTVQDLMECLKDFKPEQQVVLFDENSVPYGVDRAVIDIPNNGAMNHLMIKEAAEMNNGIWLRKKIQNNEEQSLGIKSFDIVAWRRIGELIGAIERQCCSRKRSAKLVEKWANEITWQTTMIEALQEEQE